MARKINAVSPNESRLNGYFADSERRNTSNFRGISYEDERRAHANEIYESGTKWVNEQLQSGGGSGGGGGVSSWNDLTDKPFYEEISVIAEAENVYLNPEGAEEDLLVFGELPLNGGDTILVTFDDSFVPLDSGEVYECKCVEFDGGVVAGNLANWGMVGNADAPFVLICGQGFGTAIMPLELSGINTYNIRIKKVVRKGIEPKFLPRFIVTCDTEDGTTYTADKTHQEIVDAYEAGYIVTAKVKYYGVGWYVDCVPSMIGGSMASFYGIAGGILFTATTQNLGSGQNDIVEVERKALFE